MIADGHTILVTWPQLEGGKHKQDVWYAHLSDQAEAVKAVQNACGAMNDAKVEILSHIAEDSLREHGVSKGAVKRGRPLAGSLGAGLDDPGSPPAGHQTRTVRKRSAFPTTLTEDSAMAAAATIGDKSRPNVG